MKNVTEIDVLAAIFKITVFYYYLLILMCVNKKYRS